MKKILLCLLLAGMSLTGFSQSAPEPKLDSFSKANPAQPITVIQCSITNDAFGTTWISYEVTGIGWYRCVEVCTGNQLAVLDDWRRNTGATTIIVVTCATETYKGCFFDLETVHQLPTGLY